MPLSVAEYLGQRIDIDVSDIIPSQLGGTLIPTCPFSGLACRKLSANPPQHPVCSVRVHDKNNNGKIWIVCSDRLIPAKAQGLSPSHIAALASITQVVFPGANTGDIGYKRQTGITVGKSRLVLDYVLQVRPSVNYTIGPTKVILEVQGGGETNSTGSISRHVTDWAARDDSNNSFLAQRLNTEYLRESTGQQKVNAPGIIPNNAWKRQLDQVIKKATLTMHFGGAFALVMGEVLYDYVQNSVSAGTSYFPGWQIAFLGVSERISTNSGSIPIDRVSKASFMTYTDFIAALQNFNIPQEVADPFAGHFTTLRNNTFDV